MAGTSSEFNVIAMVFNRKRTFALRNRSTPSMQAEKELGFWVIASKVFAVAP
jgi:hypothetical protein